MIKGSKHKKESIDKVRNNRKGKGSWSEKRRAAMISFLKGNTHGFKKNQHTGKEFEKGHQPWNTGLAGKGICKAWNRNLSQTESVKEKISNKLKGRKISEKVIENMKKGQQTRWNNIEEKSRMMKILSKSWKKKDTKIERLIQKELENKGITFLRNQCFFGTIPDFYVPDKKIAIYCDGKYWHSIPKVVERDKKYTEILKSNGYNVIRFHEDDILKDPSKCIRSLEMKRKSELYSDVESATEMFAPVRKVLVTN